MEKLSNGQLVKEGDWLVFENSDGAQCLGRVHRKADGSLWFWNNKFALKNYTNARLFDPRIPVHGEIFTEPF